MSKIHFTVRYFIRGKMNWIRKVEKIKGTHLRYLCCEALHYRFALLVDGEALSMVWPLACASPRFFVLQCSPTAVLSNGIVRSIPPCLRALSTHSARSFSVPQSAVHRQCPLRSSVPQSAVHRQCLRSLSTVNARSVSPYIRALPTVSARFFSVPQSAVHRQCPLHSFVPFSVPQSAVHRQCPLRSSVPHECCPLSASGKGHLLIPRCVVRHGFLVFWTLFTCFWFWWWAGRHYNGPLPWFWWFSRYTCHGFLVSEYVRATSYDLTMCALPPRSPVTRCACYFLWPHSAIVVRFGSLAS